MSSAHGEQSASAPLTQAVHQDVGQRRAALSVARGEWGDSVGKVEPEAGAFGAREKVIVPCGRVRRRDRDLVGLGDAGRNELPRPSQALDHLVADIGARNDRRHGRRIEPRDLAAKPAGVCFGWRDPLDRNDLAKSLDQGSPDGGDEGDTLDADLAEDPRRMSNAFQRGIAQVPRHHHSLRQTGFQACLDQRHLQYAAVSVAACRGEIEVSGPDFSQGPKHRPRHTR